MWMCLILQTCSLEQHRGSGPCFQQWAYLIVVPNDWPSCPIVVPAAGPDSQALATPPVTVLIKALGGAITFLRATQGATVGSVPAACQATEWPLSTWHTLRAFLAYAPMALCHWLPFGLRERGYSVSTFTLCQNCS